MLEIPKTLIGRQSSFEIAKLLDGEMEKHHAFNAKMLLQEPCDAAVRHAHITYLRTLAFYLIENRTKTWLCRGKRDEALTPVKLEGILNEVQERIMHIPVSENALVAFQLRELSRLFYHTKLI